MRLGMRPNDVKEVVVEGQGRPSISSYPYPFVLPLTPSSLMHCCGSYRPTQSSLAITVVVQLGRNKRKLNYLLWRPPLGSANDSDERNYRKNTRVSFEILEPNFNLR